MTISEFIDSNVNIDMEFYFMNRTGTYNVIDDFLKKNPHQKPISSAGWEELFKRYYPMNVYSWRVMPEEHSYRIEICIENIE